MDEVISEKQMFPLTYQAPFLDRIKPALITTPLTTLAVFGRGHLDAKSPTWIWVCALSGIVLIGLGALSIGFCRLTLYPDRIEKKSIFGKKVMKRNDIGKIVKRQSGLVMLTYKYNTTGGMMLPRNIGGGPAWDLWMDASKEI